VLEECPNARNSDSILYVEVCKKVNSDCLAKPFWYVMAKHRQFGLPSYDTVGRCRRKIQEKYPELAADSTVEGHRALNEEVYRDYARGKV
jgi:hypothetical protein